MRKEFNNPTLSLRYEIFMKKCYGKNDKEKHRIKSDNMNLLLSYSEQRFNSEICNNRYERQLDLVQDNLLSAISLLKLDPRYSSTETLNQVEFIFLNASTVNQLIDGINLGIDFLK